MGIKTPYLEVNLKKIYDNAAAVVEKCKKHGISVAGVTKVTCGEPAVARQMLAAGVTSIGETRVENAMHLKAAGITAPILLMRPPSLDLIEDIVQAFDMSLNTEYAAIKRLSEEALKIGRVHQVIVMVDMGDLREGIMPEDLIPFLEAIKDMKGIEIIGLGTNLLDLNGVIPTEENNARFVALAEEAELKCGLSFKLLSAGNSGSMELMESGKLPKRINHFRLGESIVLGREAMNRTPIKGTWQDACVLYASVIEKKTKPSLPVGQRSQNAFGSIPEIPDKGLMCRGILNIGRQDTDIEGLLPKGQKIDVIGASSDHLVVDLSMEPEINLGDCIGFELNYSALLAANTSQYVHKVFAGLSSDEEGIY